MYIIYKDFLDVAEYEVAQNRSQQFKSVIRVLKYLSKCTYITYRWTPGTLLTRETL